MDEKIKRAQDAVLAVFGREARRFALAGGTALERYHLHHRFSWDLDFFSPVYDFQEITRLAAAFTKSVKIPLKLESEITFGRRARVRFYSLPVRGSNRPLKIDFVEDVILPEPDIQKVRGVRVYSAQSIYLHKVAAIAGFEPLLDETGRPIQRGRNAPRDVFDLWMLSKKVMPLHRFLASRGGPYQKGLIHWYRTFSRHDLKLELLDMEMYDRSFDPRVMIADLENEIRLFAKGVLEE